MKTVTAVLITFVYSDIHTNTVRILNYSTPRRFAWEAWEDAEKDLHNKLGLAEPDAFNRRFGMLYALHGAPHRIGEDVPLRRPNAAEKLAESKGEVTQ